MCCGNDLRDFCPLIIRNGRARDCEHKGNDRDMGSLQGRIALVTGASQGIGRACALELARAGATVVLAARNEIKLAEAVAEIEGGGGQAVAIPLDIASEESIKAAAKAVIERFGKVEAWIDGVRVGSYADLPEAKEAILKIRRPKFSPARTGL